MNLELKIDSKDLFFVKRIIVLINNDIYLNGHSKYNNKLLKALLGENWYNKYCFGHRLLIVAKDTIKDQSEKIRLKEDEYYEVLDEYKDSFLIRDECDKECIFKKYNFYEI